jgi:hypothetical protein
MWVVVLASHVPYHVSACWAFSDEEEARRFAAFVTAEIDQAVVLRAQSPVRELLNWRDEFGARKEPS